MRLATVALAAVLAASGCGGPDSREPPREAPKPKETVFDPMTSTIGRAQGVQQTVDEQAAELRKRIEEATR